MNKNYKINYLSKDFGSIRNDLVNYAQRYYPNQLKDLSEASINSFFIEAVSYVGDMLSYYIDYQANESFLPTAIETSNILNLAKSIGYKENITTTTTGRVAVYLLIPATPDNTPDFSKAPVIKKGTSLKTSDGSKVFLLNEDVVINSSTVGANYVVGRTNSIGAPTYFAVKVYASVISGEILTTNITIGTFIKFNKIFLRDRNISEVISVLDSEGNTYYEVSNLAQNIIYQSFLNKDIDSQNEVKYMLKPISAQRRFVFGFDNGNPYILFGGKAYTPDQDLTIDPVAEPSKYIIEKYNNDFLQDAYFEPNKLLNGDNFGIGPDNTMLTVAYRRNSSLNGNADVGELSSISNLSYEFINAYLLDSDTLSTIIGSVQILNEEPIVGENVSFTSSELKDLAGIIYQAQNRAVTGKDYEALTYMMPHKFGSIKRCKAERDPNSLKNNINLYVICSDGADSLIKTNSKIKDNIRQWLSQYKMITDTVDILDAKIINLKIDFQALIDPNYDKIEVKNKIIDQLAFVYGKKPQIGEVFNKLDVYREIRKIKGVLDIIYINITNTTESGYSGISFNIQQNTSSDGNIINIPRNAIYEIKNPTVDITGKVI
jgi:hypothetical protein